ncbi:MAG: aminoglycoside phosphotransferase family protein [Chloroflexota bacterium]
MERDLGRPLALGRTAEIHAWEPGWVLKLYFDWFEPEAVDYERRIASAIHAAGLPVPAVGGTVSVAGRVGLLYERRDGASMWSDLDQHPTRLVSHARTLAELHVEMHARPMQAGIPPLRLKLERKLQAAKPLPERLRSAALAALEKMPEGDRLCHGDFHPGNVLLSQPDPVIIDWIDSSIGNPLADVARTTILALGAAAVNPSKLAYLGIAATHALYLRRYFQLRPSGRDEYRRWLPIVAAARLSEGITELEPWLLAQAGKLL